MKHRKRFSLRNQKDPRSRRLFSVLPNLLTTLSLCTGLTGIRFALKGEWELAVAAVLVAGCFDGMDGRLARFLKTTSHLGAELDSLADFVCFGVSPALILYSFALHEWRGIGWAVCLLFVICMAYRLARFNVQRAEPSPKMGKNFATGVPAPAGAFLALLPMIFCFASGSSFLRSSGVVTLFMLGSALLMISRFPTLLLRNPPLPPRAILLVLIGTAIFTASILSAPWSTLFILGCFYLCSIPLNILLIRRKNQRRKREDITSPKGRSSSDGRATDS